MKILVTGGAGFIGSHITEELVNKGYDVIVLDNLSTGRIQNLDAFREKINFIEGDIRDLELLKRITKDVDYIFHEAALSSVPRSMKSPVETNENNITGTLNVLEAARLNNVKRVIYASSSSVYGDSPHLPKKEEARGEVLSPYALQKLTGEKYCKLYSRAYGLKTISLRYFNVFGERQNPHSEYAAVIPLFVKLILNNETPTIFGTGENSRDFTYVKNVVHANMLAMEKDIKGGEAINVGNGKNHDLNKLVSLINARLEKNAKTNYSSMRPGDVLHSLADISAANKLLGYSPKFTFEEGLNRTIDHLKSEV